MFDNYQSYLIPLAVIMFLAWKFVRGFMVKRKIPDFLARGAIIVDVRSNEEFLSASSTKSINIPLDEIDGKLKTLDKGKPILLCCASGMRSGIAEKILRKNGFDDVLNIGAWTNIEQ